MHLWQFDLRVPICYWGDALYFNVLVKALKEGLWNFHIARLAAPFGMDTVDFPLGCTLDFAAMKVLLLVVHNPILVVNLYWLGAIGLASAFATLFLRSLGIGDIGSAVFGSLYGIIPFTFYRNVAHLNLVHFVVPIVIYLAVTIADGRILARWRQRIGLRNRLVVVALPIGLSVVVGLEFVYWTFFAGIILAIAAVIGACRFRSLVVPMVAAICIATMLITALATLAPTFLFWRSHGPNRALAYKAPAEADVYALTIRQMITPTLGQPIPLLEQVRQKIARAGFPNETNESNSAALGTIGSLGLILLILVILVPRGKGLLGDVRLQTLAAIAVGLILVAQAGGFGSVFNAVVLPDFRAYNRVAPFIALCSFGGLAIAGDYFVLRFSSPIRAVPFILVMLFGLRDQIPTPLFASRASEVARFYADRRFINMLEKQLPRGAMVYQLPYTAFPLEISAHYRMLPLDNARPYLHSRYLNWSWGAFTGRNNDWSAKTAELPAKDLVQRLAMTGFEGILLDRNGFSNAGLESAISRALGPTFVFDLGGRWVFYSVAERRARLQHTLSATELQEQERAARSPIRINWGPRFSVYEKYGDAPGFRWCGSRGVMTFDNDTSAERQVELSMALRQYATGVHRFVVERPDGRQELATSGQEPAYYRDRLVVPPQGKVNVEIIYDSEALPSPPGETRELAFQVLNFQWREIGSSGAEIAAGDE